MASPLGPTSKRLLTAVFASSLLGERNSVEAIVERLQLDREHVNEACSRLLKQKFLSEANGELRLTSNGRKNLKVVFAGGVFDIIHPGHLHTLMSAKELGDVLVVVVARDKTVVTNKGRRPFNAEEQRLALVRGLKVVDAAMLGVEGDIFETLLKVRPDLVALGYDQKHDAEGIEREAMRRGLKVRVVRLSSPIPEVKSSRILNEF